jgi:23S rRNA (guanosine2251-2'-O)-methyltransferase
MKKPQGRPQERPFFRPGDASGLFRLFGRKPVLEALRMGVVKQIDVSRRAHGKVVDEILELAAEQRVDVRRVEEIAGEDDFTMQGIVANAYPPVLRDDLKYFVRDLPESPFPLLLMLDGITDPHNFGAILRTAEGAGVTGVIIRERRQVQITEVVVKSSAGAAYLIPIFQVTNLSQCMRLLTEEGFWSVAASGETETSYRQYNWKAKTLLIVGAEGAGVSDLLEREADDRISIPMYGHIESLNVSVATGVLLYEAARNRELIISK